MDWLKGHHGMSFILSLSYYFLSLFLIFQIILGKIPGGGSFGCFK